MHQPLITVYITNFNYERFIKQSIQSVFKQSMQDFELIIIDDGSTDNSKAIIEQYRGMSNVSIIYQQNKGLNITNNIAMRAAAGRYLMRLDADDFLEPEALQVMSDILEKDDALGLVFPDYYYVDKEGARIGEERRHNFQKEVSLYDQPAHGACTMIRLEFLKNIGGYNESFTCQDGYDLWIKFIMHYSVTNVNQPLFSYRQHGNNLTTNEERILSTRQKIKESFVKENLKLPKTLAIIPVRNNFIGEFNWPLYKINGKSILLRKVEKCLESQLIEKIIISIADVDVKDEIRNWSIPMDRLEVIERPKSFALSSETLAKTVSQVLEHISLGNDQPEAIMTLSLEYPFLTRETIDDSLYTMVIFDADTVLSVRTDNSKYYQHTGHTLQPILNHEKFTKLEREALYRGAGGIILTKIKSFRNTENLISGKVSHVIVDRKSEFIVASKFDLEVANGFLDKN